MPVYVHLIDSRQRALSGPTGEPRAFVFVAFEEADTGPLYGAIPCAKGEVTVRGWSAYVSDGKIGRIVVEPIVDRSNPVLRAMCAGVVRPLSSIVEPDAAATLSTDATVFDYASRGIGFGIFILIPGYVDGRPYEHTLVRYHWAHSIRPMYEVSPDIFQMLQSPEFFAQASRLEAGKPISIDFQGTFNFWGVDERDPYFLEDGSRFSREIKALDAEWLAFISRTGVTIRHKTSPLVADGEVAQIVPIFRVEELGSAKFWQSAGDLIAMMQQMDCVSATFLVDGGYAPVAEVQTYLRCPRRTVPVIATTAK